MTEAKWAEVDNDPGLIFTLQSIQRNAPWARHIYVLQNPACESVWKRKLKRNLIPEASKCLVRNMHILDKHTGHIIDKPHPQTLKV